jgi:hypothetical protein
MGTLDHDETVAELKAVDREHAERIAAIEATLGIGAFTASIHDAPVTNADWDRIKRKPDLNDGNWLTRQQAMAAISVRSEATIDAIIRNPEWEVSIQPSGGRVWIHRGRLLTSKTDRA